MITDEEVAALIALASANVLANQPEVAPTGSFRGPSPTAVIIDEASAPDVKRDLLRVIENTILNHPRSLQTRIGPSEVGTPCLRKLGYKLNGTRSVRGRWPGGQWPATVGTALHSWAQEAFAGENAQLGWDRWLIEEQVDVGEIAGSSVTGQCDLYDALTFTVIDWKFPGLRSFKAKLVDQHPGETYRKQVHLYGRGNVRAGRRVDRVGVMFVPTSGSYTDAFFWSEPYDEQVAIEALSRADGVVAALDSLGDSALGLLPPTWDYCERCPWQSSRIIDDPRVACPGVDIPMLTGPVFGSV